MSKFSNFAISFPIICILSGGINSFAQAIDISRLSSFTNCRGAAGGEVFPQSDNMFYLFLFCLLLPVYTIPDMNAAAAQGWGAFFGTVNAIWTAALLCILHVMLALSIKVGEQSIYVIVVNSTHVFPFLSFTIPLVAAKMNHGGPKRPSPGPWAMSAGVNKLVTVRSVVGMTVILLIAVAPPNERVLYVVMGVIVLALILWSAVESRRFEGPPTGERMAARKAATASAKATVGDRT
jgi:hypothetical protein